MIQNILFACDFSSSSNRALSYAADLVERTGAHLHLRHVQEIPLGPLVEGDPSPDPGGERLQNEFEERCRTVLQSRSDAVPDERLSFSVQRSGKVAPALVQFAEDENIDLIVMGTHGRRGVRRAFFGSTAEEVLRTAPCPVMVTRADDEERGTGMTTIDVERLVVPTDFSDPSRAALRYAARLSSVYSVPIALVHVVDLPSLPRAYEIDFSETDIRAVEERAREELREWGRALGLDDEALSCVVESGTPASTILGIASKPEDLLVMATHGRTGLTRTMLGSVAEDVLRRAEGPVLTGRIFPDT